VGFVFGLDGVVLAGFHIVFFTSFQFLLNGQCAASYSPAANVLSAVGGQPMKGDGTLITKLSVLPQIAKILDLALSCLT
jgi:hypothetical protein